MSDITKRTILVVDDELDARDMLQEFLSGEGYAVTCAEDAESALAHLAQSPVDLMITDIRMPGISGVELTRQVKERYPRMGVIIITAHLGLYDDTDIRKSGADDFLQKPFNLKDLSDRIERVLFLQDSLKRQG